MYAEFVCRTYILKKPDMTVVQWKSHSHLNTPSSVPLLRAVSTRFASVWHLCGICVSIFSTDILPENGLFLGGTS